MVMFLSYVNVYQMVPVPGDFMLSDCPCRFSPESVANSQYCPGVYSSKLPTKWGSQDSIQLVYNYNVIRVCGSYNYS